MTDGELGLEGPVPALSIGAIHGGPERDPWKASLRDLTLRVSELRDAISSPLNVNVVFMTPGSVLSPDFTGIRTGSWFKQESVLVIQVALPAIPPPDEAAYLRDAMVSAVDLAESWAARRRLDTSALHDLVRKL